MYEQAYPSDEDQCGQIRFYSSRMLVFRYVCIRNCNENKRADRNG